MSATAETSKQSVLKWPVVSAVLIIVGVTIVEIAGVIAAETVGLPEPALPVIALLIGSVIALGLIRWFGWWQDAGFVTTLPNVPALTVPFLLLFPVVVYFGIIEISGPIFGFLLLLFFLTALSEEALFRGFLLRLLLPRGRVFAVVVTAALFGLTHLPQLLQGMAINDNLLQIGNSFVFGLLYGAVRLRINNIWPLIIGHMLFDVNSALAGVFGPTAVRTITDIPPVVWLVIVIPSLIAAAYYLWKPSTATIDGRPVSESSEPVIGERPRPS